MSLNVQFDHQLIHPSHRISCPHAGHRQFLFFRKKVIKKLSAALFALMFVQSQLHRYRKDQGRLNAHLIVDAKARNRV